MPFLANSRVLFDFEVVCLITLFIGLGVFGLFQGTFRRKVSEGIGSEFVWQDLAMVWVPLALFIATPILSFVLPSDTNSVESNPYTAQIMQLNVFLIIGALTWFMIAMFGVRKPKEILGFSRERVPMVLLYGIIGAFVAFLVCTFAIGIASKAVLTDIFGDLNEQKPVEQMRQLKSNYGLLLLAVLNACVAAPIVEEMLFRGYFYGVIKRFSSPLFSALITGAIFAVVHMNIASLVPLWVLAIFLSLAYEFTRSIWVPIAIHAFFNLISVCMIIFWPEPQVQPATLFSIFPF